MNIACTAMFANGLLYHQKQHNVTTSNTRESGTKWCAVWIASMVNLKAMVIYFFVTIMGAIGTRATTSVPTEKGKTMTKWKICVLQLAVFVLILQGISSIWELVDVATYGESQKSAVDAIAAVFMTDWIYAKIWRKDNGESI